MAEFKMAHSANNNVVEFDFWYSSANDKALDFLEDFAEMDKKLGEKVKLVPHFVFWECRGCDANYLATDCYGGGKYCAVEPSNHAIKGHEIVLEDIRQKCIWMQAEKTGSRQAFWDYIKAIRFICSSAVNEDCSVRGLNFAKINPKVVQKCVADSFTSADWQDKSTNNTIIDKEIQYWRDYGTNVFPSVVINKKTYRGQLEPLSVFNAICAGFDDPPEQCFKTLHIEP